MSLSASKLSVSRRKPQESGFHSRITRALAATLCAAVMMGGGITLLPAYEPTEDPDYGKIAPLVAKLLERDHFSRMALNDEASRQILENWLKNLDYNKLFFLESEVEQFRADYGSRLDEMVKAGDLSAAQEIHDAFKLRVQDRVEKIDQLLEKDYTFDSDRTVRPSRKEAEWAKSVEELDDLWQRRIEGELLQVHLSDDAEEVEPAKVDDDPETEGAIQADPNQPEMATPQEQYIIAENAAPAPEAEATAEDNEESAKEIVAKRYQRILDSVEERDAADVAAFFLTVIAQTYDPHTTYLSAAQLDNFKINMELSLEGIGAMLRAEDDYATVVELVPGGPADRQGELQVNDKIIAVAQGEGKFQDVKGWKLEDIVQLIRGEKDSIVRLRIIPAKAVDPSDREEISIVRGKVELKEAAASAQLRVHKEEETEESSRIGWITIPSFYADLDSRGDSQVEQKSTTTDVSILIKRLKQENIDGLVIDLTQNGGGSLEEAINLTGLFIGKGPVVQVKNPTNITHVYRNLKFDRIYEGPMVVLLDRSSASASEIFAGALQDYSRAVIVGDSSTFGKGTVQTMLYLDQQMPFWQRIKGAGALKLTVQKYYRVAGQSTQLRGVVPDIILPSAYDYLEYGERALDNPLPYDEVKSAEFSKFSSDNLYLDGLRSRSEKRVSDNLGFQLLQKESQRMKEQQDKNLLSLNLDTRREKKQKEQDLVEERNDKLKQLAKSDDLIYEITLDNVGEEKLHLADSSVSSANEQVHKARDDAQKSADPTAQNEEGSAGQKVAESETSADAGETAALPDPETDALPSEDDPAFTYSHFMKEEAMNILLDLIKLRENGPKTAGIN